MSDAQTAAPTAAPAPDAGATPAPAPMAGAPAAASPAPEPSSAPTAAPAATAPSPAPAATPAPTPAPTAAAAAAPAVPEKYEFQLPEGMQQLDEAVTGEFSALAKEKGLSQEDAQKFFDIGVKLQTRTGEQLRAAFETQVNGWTESAKTDKEFGGDKFDENLAVALKARDQFATPEFVQFLNESKLGNHPEMIRAFYRIGQAISQDGFVPGRGGANASRDARSIYSASNMNP